MRLIPFFQIRRWPLAIVGCLLLLAGLQPLDAQMRDCEEFLAETLVELGEYESIDAFFDDIDRMSDDEFDEFFEDSGLFEWLDACDDGEIQTLDEALMWFDDTALSSDSGDDSERIELRSAGGGLETSDDVAAMRQLADRVTTNDQGYPQATFAAYDLTLMYVPAGAFIMGSDDLSDQEAPAHEVHQDGFWISRDMITNAQFEQFVTATGYVTDAESAEAEGCFVYVPQSLAFEPVPGRFWRNAFENLRPAHPVVCVSRYDATAYADWLSDEIGLQVALPTESQWEKAARGTEGFLYPWGNSAPDGSRANYADAAFVTQYAGALQARPDSSVNDGYADTSPAGSYPAGASPYGVLDMAGNASEWVADGFSYYDGARLRNPFTPATEDTGINRGGSWVEAAGFPPLSADQLNEGHIIRSAHRAGGDSPFSSDDHLGFRVVVDYLARP